MRRTSDGAADPRFVEAGGLKMAYLERGPSDGPPVILLHGFPYDALAWLHVADRLAAQRRRCLLPYLRGFGPTRFCDPATPRSGQQAALGADLLAFLDALEIQKANLCGFDWGGRAACIVAALWPERVSGLVSCGQGYNIQAIAEANRPAPPAEEARYWYIYLLQTERGRAALTDDRDAFCRFLWETWSPTWSFDAATFDGTAVSFGNPDFVDIVLHSYRHRMGTAVGDPRYDEIERRLATSPSISVPAVVLQGEADGVDPASDRDADRHHFIGPYARRVLPNVGHNAPLEAPEAVADAIISLESLRP